jgi:hypothetical protein
MDWDCRVGSRQRAVGVEYPRRKVGGGACSRTGREKVRQGERRGRSLLGALFECAYTPCPFKFILIFCRDWQTRPPAPACRCVRPKRDLLNSSSDACSALTERTRGWPQKNMFHVDLRSREMESTFGGNPARPSRRERVRTYLVNRPPSGGTGSRKVRTPWKAPSGCFFSPRTQRRYTRSRKGGEECCEPGVSSPMTLPGLSEAVESSFGAPEKRRHQTPGNMERPATSPRTHVST